MAYKLIQIANLVLYNFSQPEEFFIIWYHVGVVMVDGKGEGGAGGARVQVGRPVVRVERVERGVRWWKSATIKRFDKEIQLWVQT